MFWEVSLHMYYSNYMFWLKLRHLLFVYPLYFEMLGCSSDEGYHNTIKYMHTIKMFHLLQHSSPR